MRVLLTGTDPEGPRGGIGVAMSGYRAALEEAGALDRLIPSYRPGGIHGSVWLAARAAVSIVRRTRELRGAGVTPVVYAHGGAAVGLLRQALLVMLARAAGARTMLHLHSMTVDRYLRTRRGRIFLRVCTLAADRVCVHTAWWMKRLEPFLGRDRIAIVPNPLPPAVEAVARSEDGRDDRRPQGDTLRILCMTRLVPGKGVDALIEAMAFLRDGTRLRVAGEGPQRDALRDLARTAGVADRVEFLGWIGGRAKDRALRACDVFCLPTLRDSFGMGFIEAMAHGRPVVAVGWGPIADVVPDGEAGILVEAQEPRAIADAIARLEDHSMRSEMGARARGWVLRQFAADAVGERIRTVLDSLSTENPGPGAT